MASPAFPSTGSAGPTDAAGSQSTDPSHAVAAELGAGSRKWSRRSTLLDLGSLIVSLLAAIVEVIALTGQVDQTERLGDYIGLAVTLVGIAFTRNYLWFWRTPEFVRGRLWIGALLVVLGPLTATLLGGEPLVTWTIAVFTAFSISLRGLPGLASGAFVASGVYLAIVLADNVGYVNATAFVALAMSFTAAASGSALRNYVRLQREFEQRALDALASRDAEANQRVAEERLRIARDLHDLVGHEIAVLGIHLGVAEVNISVDAGAARSALESARVNVQSVLAETQRILHVLRSSTPEDPADASSPAADFAHIPSLVATYRDAGMDVRVELCAPPAGINPEVSTAAYRVIQEALTNAQRHGSGPTWLTVTDTDRVLTVEVTNAKGRPDPSRASHRGYGLVGMRERVTSAGGQLRIDNNTSTFAIVALLQIDGKTL
jgi:signal transduction histidine kinase